MQQYPQEYPLSNYFFMTLKRKKTLQTYPNFACQKAKGQQQRPQQKRHNQRQNPGKEPIRRINSADVAEENQGQAHEKYTLVTAQRHVPGSHLSELF